MGSTRDVNWSCYDIWDHPHIHGEHLRLPGLVDKISGSPPYTWGAQPCSPGVWYDEGITPIYMGSTFKSGNETVCLQDHPHIHGEHSLRFALGRKG